MKGNGKSILSIFLAGVIAVTTVGYAPPFTSSASWKTNMEKALELLSSPSEASKQESTATPSEAENPGREVTPSEAEIPDGKATPSQAVKKFVRVEPEEIPEYYSQVSASGKKFWKFEDRNGMVQYRDYGYVQGEAEFPLWYVTDLTGTVDDTYESVNLDEEYYSEAPYIYANASLDNESWEKLSQILFMDSTTIEKTSKKESKPFINWDKSEYTIQNITYNVKPNESNFNSEVGIEELGLTEPESSNNEFYLETTEDLGYYFYGVITNNSNEIDNEAKWYYADENGIITEINNNELKASLMATSVVGGLYYFDATNNGNNNADQYLTPGYSDTDETWFTLRTPVSLSGYTFIGWASHGQSIYGTGFELPQNSSYSGYGTFYLPSTKIQWKNIKAGANSVLIALRKPNGTNHLRLVTNYDKDFHDGYAADWESIVVRNPGTVVDLTLSSYKSSKTGYVFDGYYTGKNGTGAKVDSITLNSDSIVYANYIPNQNRVRFIGDAGEILSEQIVESGKPAIAPTPPVVSGKIFTGWNYNFSEILADIDIKAQYKSSITVKIMGNSGTVYGQDEYTAEVEINSTTSSLLDIVNKNVSKKGYNTSTYLWRVVDSDGNESSVPYRFTEDTTIRINWQVNNNYVVFYRNFPQGDTADWKNKTVAYGDKLGKIPDVYPVGKGYRLKGWYLDKWGTGEAITPDYDGVGGETGSESLKLYAKWETFDVTYNIDYGIENTGYATQRVVNSTVSADKLVTSYLKPVTDSKLLIPGYSNTYYTDKKDDSSIYSSTWYPTDEVVNLYLKRFPKKVYINLFYPNSTNTSYSNKDLTSLGPNNYYNNVIAQKDLDYINNYLATYVTGNKIFKGFYADSFGKDAIDFTKPIEAKNSFEYASYISMPVYAIYANEQNKITLKNEDDSLISETIVKYGEKFSFPTDLVKPRYTLDGWYTAKTGGTKYPQTTGEVEINSDITLYARWVKTSCEVIFKDWDGTVLEVQEVPVGNNAVNHIPERPDYEFMGWNKSLDNIRYDTTITATYSLISDLKQGYNISFVKYGFNKYTQYNELIAAYSKIAYLHRKRLPFNNYWLYLDTDYYNTSRFTAEIDFPKDESDANNYLIGWTLYPVSSYTSYNRYGKGLYASRTSETFKGQIDVDRGERLYGFPLFQARDKVKIREFIGLDQWSSSSTTDGFGLTQLTALYLPKDKASLVLVSGNKDYYSTFHSVYDNYWDHSDIGESNFTTVFQKDTPFIESISVENFGSKINIYIPTGNPKQRVYMGTNGEEIIANKESSNDYWYLNYKLVGYYQEPNGVGKELLGSYTFNKVDDRYYAYYVAQDATVDVTYTDDNGNIIGSESVDAGGKCINIPEGPNKPGYKFIGWESEDSDNSSSTNKTIKDTTYVPKYEKITVAKHKLVLDGNGGVLDGLGSQEYNVEEQSSIDDILLDMANKVQKDDSIFDGWYTAPVGGTKLSSSGNIMSNSDVTYYARWKYIQLRTTLYPRVPKSKDLNSTAVTTVEYGQPLTNGYITSFGLSKLDSAYFPSTYNYEFDDFTFLGWYTEPNGKGTKIFEGDLMYGNQGDPKGEVVLYGNWKINKYIINYNTYDNKLIKSEKVVAGENANPPVAPARVNNVFTGWSNPEVLINVQGDATVSATYVREILKITLHANGGTLDGTNTSLVSDILYGELFDNLLYTYKYKVKRPGYTFAGWYDTAVGGTKFRETNNTMIWSKLNIYAHWTGISYTVKYVDHLGNTLKTNTLSYGQDSTPPVNPTRAGYTFKGWSDPSTNITSNLVISPVYEINKYTVTFKDWDGTILSTEQVDYDGTVIPPINPSRDYFQFTGWDKPSTNIQNHTTITAQYTANRFTLTLDGNGGTISGDETKSQMASFGESIDQLLTDGAANASRKDYSFDGWYTMPNGGIKYNGSGNTMPASSVTVYAHWVRNSSEVVYKDWNGNVLKTQEVAIGADATPPSDPVRAGYTFTGWDKPSTNIQNHTTITAQYTANSFTLTLDGNGGTISGEETKSQMISFGESIDQEFTDGAAQASRKYYTFGGWYTMPTGGIKYTGSGNTMPASSVTVYAHWVRNSSEVVYKDWNGDVLKTQEVAIGADATPPSDPVRAGYAFTGWDKASANIKNHTTITAQYTVNGFTLTLNGNGGTISGNAAKSQTISFGESIDQVLEDGVANASRKYYTFGSWYTMPTGGIKYTGSGNTMPASSVTVYAHWVRNSSEVVYKDWNGNVLKTQEVAIGADATPPSDPVRAGYAFTGWDKASTNIQNHTTITAQYTANRFILTLDGNGGTIAGEETKSQTISFGESIDQALEDGAANVSRKYYTFDGWYTMPTGGSKYTGSGNTMPASSVKVYAHWVRNSSEVVYKDWDGNVIKTQEVGIGADATPPSDPIRAGYAFTGWDKASTNIQNHTTITAQYTVNGFTLTLDGNGGTISGNTAKSQTISYGESIDQVLEDGVANASRKYYTFGGWYTMPTGGSKYTGSGNTMPAFSVTVYAHWVRNSSKVVYKDWNGDVLKAQEVAIGADATPPSDPVRAGYAFTGWDKTSTNIQYDTSITAIYTADEYKHTTEDKSSVAPVLVPPTIDTTTKPTVPDSGGKFIVNPENPYDVTYTKPDGTPAKDEWVGDGREWYHLDEKGKINYDWYLEGEKTWYKFNMEKGDRLGAALIGWNHEPMDDKWYFFDPTTTKMLTGWQNIDGKSYYFTTNNEGQTYFGSNLQGGSGWKYDPNQPGKPYGSMYRNEYTPNGYWVDEDGVCADKK